MSSRVKRSEAWRSPYLKWTREIATSLLLLAMTLTHSPSLAAETTEVPRTILALWDSQVDDGIYFTNIHQSAEVVLNHLGLKVKYRSIHDPLPQDKDMKGVRGILTWFTDRSAVPNQKTYCAWLKKQMVKGIKVVILEQFGLLKSKTARLIPECRSAFRMLGGEYGAEFSENPYFLKIVKMDPKMVEFERKLVLTEEINYALVKTTKRPQTEVYLDIKRTDLGKSNSALVFTTDHGGYAHPTFVIYENKDIDRRHWRLNPFAFFAKAFDVEKLPKIDTTTINGTRIFYNHIDGDGIFNISNIDKKSFSGEILYKDILKKYSDIPITVSLITGYFDMRRYHNERTKKLYKEIFSLNNVEPASHGYAHPLKWQKETVALDLPGYSFNAKKEIQGSVQMMRSLMTELKIPKKVGLFLWTGDCRPNRQEILDSYSDKTLNMNGGDSRFDKRYDSYSYVFPLGVLRNGILQIYSSASNENIYTNLWEGPYYGYRLVPETFYNTEHPIRIKPINVYYHFYSAERQASLSALIDVYNYVLKQDIFPIFASAYPKIVGDFFDAKMYKISNGYKFIHNGNLATVRYDGETRSVDLERSKGVIGFQYFQNSLYVSLDGGKETIIILSDKKPQRPYMVSATFHVKDFMGNQSQVTFSKKGWYKSKLKLGGLKANRIYVIKSNMQESRSKTDQDGILNFQFPSAENNGPYRKVEIKVLSN